MLKDVYELLLICWTNHCRMVVNIVRDIESNLVKTYYSNINIIYQLYINNNDKTGA